MSNTEIGIRLIGAVELPVIQKLEFHIATNGHGVMEVKGIASSKDMIEEESMYGKTVGMEWPDKDGESIPLFQGVISNLDIYRNGEYREVSIQAVTGTCLMDAERKSRSFQDTDMTYADVVKAVIKDVQGSAVITTEGKQKIERPLIQYQETDWEFIKRLAGLAGTAVIPDIKYGLPKFWFGMRKGKERAEISETSFRTIVHDRYKVGNYSKKAEKSYVLRGKPGMEIGDILTINGQKCVIYRIDGALISEELIYDYWLGTPQMGKQERFYIPHISGMSLKGTVEKTDCESVYIKLDIDGHGGRGEYAYDYNPLTGQIMYCMPERNTAVSLSYMNADEREAIVTDNPGWGEGRLTTGDSTMKRLETDYGKNLFFFPSAMGMSTVDDKGQTSRIMMADKDCTLLESSKNLTISANGQVMLKASAINIHVPNSIEIKQNG